MFKKSHFILGPLHCSISRYLFRLIIITLIIVSIRGIGVCETTGSIGDVCVTLCYNELEQNVNPYFDCDDQVYYLFLPMSAQNTPLKLGLINDSKSLQIDEKIYQAGEPLETFASDSTHTLCLLDADGRILDQSNVIIMYGSSIASMFIQTESGNLDYVYADKSNKESGQIALYTEGGALDYAGKLSHIKGRGNSTWWAAKKPFNIKLEEKKNLLGLGKSKSWVLLANYFDPPMMRNTLALSFGLALGLDYTSNSEYCDLYINNNYMGMYQLTEKIKVKASGVDITPPTQESVQGDYLFEITEPGRLNQDEDSFFLTKQGVCFSIIEPETPTEAQLEYAKAIIQEAEQALSQTELSNENLLFDEIIDLDSAVKVYLVNEIFKNQDAGILSTFLYYTEHDELIHHGPIWDFDMSMGNGYSFSQTSSVLFTSTVGWFEKLYKNDVFRNGVVEQYRDLCLPILDYFLSSYIDEIVTRISSSVAMDGMLFDNQSRPSWSTDSALPYDQQVMNIKNFLSERVAFLNSAWLDNVDYHIILLDCGDVFFSYERYFHYSVVDGETFTIPYCPQAEGYKFLGWYYEKTDQLYDDTAPVKTDVNLEAHWEK